MGMQLRSQLFGRLPYSRRVSVFVISGVFVVADDLGALALAGWKLFLAASLRTLEVWSLLVFGYALHACEPSVATYL